MHEWKLHEWRWTINVNVVFVAYLFRAIKELLTFQIRNKQWEYHILKSSHKVRPAIGKGDGSRDAKISSKTLESGTILLFIYLLHFLNSTASDTKLLEMLINFSASACMKKSCRSKSSFRHPSWTIQWIGYWVKNLACKNKVPSFHQWLEGIQ